MSSMLSMEALRTYQEAVAGSTFRRWQDEITFAIRDRREGDIERLRTLILQDRDLFEISDEEACQLLDYLNCLSETVDEETYLKWMLRIDPEFLKRNSPDQYRQALLWDNYRRANGRAVACAHLQFDTKRQAEQCMKARLGDCNEICPARAEKEQEELHQLAPLAA